LQNTRKGELVGDISRRLYKHTVAHLSSAFTEVLKKYIFIQISGALCTSQLSPTCQL